ncbi:hypothetical protein PHSY_006064 [Pseudozyma hubeiensis SY62]|uniref:Polynucleotide 5'-hydroxyl-kinase GRC3 n=1 Tax=Pseudozyma hubeiensis (strain SY62) TaxID=1305764 RepID=R9PK36_PSEHS|nr:hypothetical protein PHSY_006064 [Pseudozyma hubeiensis SY62]GAC98470.1 hypothetical protein PHSY_006064 [Pseudozyma hubeiensis SY62]
MSALAARKAREEAQAARSGTTRASASASENLPAASTSRSAPSHTEEGDVSIEVVIPLPSTSQAAAASRSTTSSSSIDRTPSSALKRPRRSSLVQDGSSIAATRPRRNSSVASVEPQSQATLSRSTKGKVPQVTPSRSSANKPPLTKSTPVSAKKKAKHSRSSMDDQSDQDDELDRDIEKIVADFHREASTSEFKSSEPEQPPPKKRAKQPTGTPYKRTPTEPAPADKTAPRKTSRKKTALKQVELQELSASTTKSEQPVKRKLTDEQKRLSISRRYFAAAQKHTAKDHVGTSSMPIEDRATGFLAFGVDDDEDDEPVQVNGVQDDAQSQDQISDDSSDDEQQQAQQAASNPAPGLINGSKHRANGKSRGRETRSSHTATKIVLDDDDDDDDEEQDDEAGTDNDDDGAASPKPTTLTRAALLDAVPYSNFTPVLEGEARNAIVVENKRKRGKEALYFGLRIGQTLVFLGVGHVEVLQGVAQLGGAVISASAQGLKSANIFAPITNPLPVLKSTSASSYPGHNFASSSSRSSSSNSADNTSDTNIDTLFDATFDTIVKVTPLASPITALGQVCPIGGLATPFIAPPSLELSNEVYQLAGIKVLFAPTTQELVQRPRALLGDGRFSTVGLSATYIPHKWQLALHHLSRSAMSAAQHPQEESVVALVRGNKKVGKSTLSRMALERLLSMGKAVGGRVAYLELDLGQSDFGPPGMVALHVLTLTDNSCAKAAREEVDPIHRIDSTRQEASETENAEAVTSSDFSDGAHSSITLGPGWCQPRVPARAHFVGDVSPRDDPESYVAAVLDLIEYFRAQVQPGDPNEDGVSQRVPLVINTQGWIKGLGADLASRIEPMLRPTHIFDVIPRGSPDPLPPPIRGQPWLDAEGAILGSGPEIVTLESVSQLEFVQGSFGNGDRRTATDVGQLNGMLRANDEGQGPGDGGSTPPRYVSEVGSRLAPAESRLLNMMSYLYATQLSPGRADNSFQIQGSWNFSEPLVHRRPLVVDVAQGLKAGIRVLALGSSVPDSLKLMALNSSIVAIVVMDASVQVAEAQEQHGPWKAAFHRAAEIVSSDLASSSRCVGLGIVRSIDAEAGRVHLLTPLDPAFLHEIQSTTGIGIGLVKGALELPVWASLDFQAIKEARESRLDVPPATHHLTVNGQEQPQQQQQLLAGMPRNQVPYLEWPHSIHPASRQNGSNNTNSNGAGAFQLGSEKRRIRRNLMRKSQFV